jgi:DNA-binding phage protein
VIDLLFKIMTGGGAIFINTNLKKTTHARNLAEIARRHQS